MHETTSHILQQPAYTRDMQVHKCVYAVANWYVENPVCVLGDALVFLKK